VPISEKVIFFSAVSVVDAKPFAINSFPLVQIQPRHCEERSDEAIHISACGAMDCFASLAMTILNIFILLLLLLLLLLVGLDHAVPRERNRLAQHLDVADVIRQDQDQRGIEIRALLVVQAAMRFHDGAEGVIGLGKVRSGRQRHDEPSVQAGGAGERGFQCGP
jgi:hypothetical protein